MNREVTRRTRENTPRNAARRPRAGPTQPPSTFECGAPGDTETPYHDLARLAADGDGQPHAAWKRRFRRRLGRWFVDHARQLPWRPSPGLYETWVSEIMLQQTQVATVIPYYQRFLARFPSVEVLAGADEQEVLRHWEGLGYYRRARQLHAAAKQIVAEHAGRFPTTIEQVLALPGIGRYTAGAILSIALDQRQPILEANTVRVLSRLLAYREDPTRSAGQRRLWDFAERLLPRRRVGDFNQALMELGSVLCTPRQPACDRCPVAALCPTHALGLQDEIPRRKEKTAYVAKREAAVVVRCDGHVLLRRCGAGERWAGLWDFPRFDVVADGGAALDRELVAKVAATTGVSIPTTRPLATLKHGVTKYRITLTCHEATCARRQRGKRDVQWVAWKELSRYPLSVTGRKISRLLAPACEGGRDGTVAS